MKHILDIKEKEQELHQIFKQIREGNSILFIGAGASVGEKRYLSKEIIEYYEEYLGKDLNESDITRFVDILSADGNFDRNHFDLEVEQMLRKLKVTEGHRIMASIPWLEIITTNYDLLVEQTFDELKVGNLFELIPVRSLKKYNYRSANNEIKYIKLNGCISDKSEYPLVFSTDDFRRTKSFYKNILNDLKNISPKISFISIGYSFRDALGQQLLEKFDSYNFRERRWMINVDPYPNESALAYYSKQKIRIVKCSFNDFFKAYDEWNEKGLDYIVKKKRLVFTSSRESQIAVPNKLAIQLNGVIKQLNSHVMGRLINKREYYKGEEPNYRVILSGLDVIRNIQCDNASHQIKQVVENNSSPFIPVFFMTGEFGIGKSTFALRLIHELNKNEDLDLVAFEVLDFMKLKKEYLIELFNLCNAKNIVLLCDEIEVDSTFKSLLEIRRELSIEQFNDFNVFFIAPIRENILAMHRSQRDIKEAHEISINGTLTENEIDDLLDKLKSADLIDFRGELEKKQLCKKILQEYSGDSFISLLELVTGGKHVNDLIGAYNELSQEVQEAFKFTALLHRHKLLMPANWLKHIISLDWDLFIDKVIRAEGKGILIQEEVEPSGTNPNLFFRTKHPIISERLIEKLLPSKDKQFKLYVRMLNTVDFGATNSFLVTNLLKSFRSNEIFSSSKISKLYDIAYTKLSDDPYYLLNYAINLQKRGTESDLKKGLDQLIYAESLLDYRNHRFIHRRAVMNFELAKIYYKREDQLNFTIIYLNEAKELFLTKQLLDPFSAYSYVDYIRLLIWEIKNINYDEESQLQLRIHIQELFDLANRTVTEDISWIENVRIKYTDYLKKATDNVEYKVYLDELYANIELRPYACILLYSYYESLGEHGKDKRLELIDEMKNYLDNNEVVKFLFKYYGRRLHNNNNRIFFFKLSRTCGFLEDDIPLRYNYYHFVAESYNRNFKYGLEHLKQIKAKYNGLNPDFHIVWKDDDGEEVIFDGLIIKKSGQRYKGIKITSLQKFFRLIRGNYKSYAVGQKVKIKLHYYLDGLRAEIMKSGT